MYHYYTRHVDELGRVVLPLELRHAWGIVPNNTVVFCMQDDGTITLCAREPDLAPQEK